MPDVEKQTIATVKKILPSVVSIIISKFIKEKKIPVAPAYSQNSDYGMALPEQILGTYAPDVPHHAKQRVKVGGGSGVVISSDGLIITNKHVVYDADAKYTVITFDEKEYEGVVVSRDPINDVALIRIEARGLVPAKLGDSDRVELGQTVVAIGNALGVFSNTISKGIISGLSRKVTATLGKDQTENLRHVMQTDVAINQGNSGGPLLNLNGDVIAINTAVIYGAQNIGFAIPINWAKKDIQDLKKYGRIIRPYIGLHYVTLDQDLQNKYDLEVDHGALVMKDHAPGAVAIIKGSPADKAGIEENDIILSINGTKLTIKDELSDVVEEHKVGDVLNLEILRKGKKINLDVILSERR